MLSWPNSPLLVLPQFVDPNVLCGDATLEEDEDHDRLTPLQHLTHLADHRDFSTHVNQLILAKQLIEHGANVNTVTIREGNMPLHIACAGSSVTNLNFVELHLREGADPNAQDPLGHTPLMCTTIEAPGAVKFLLNWPTTDANITNQFGASFLALVRAMVKAIFEPTAAEFLTDEVAIPDNLEREKNEFLLRQWREVEEMLMEKGAHDTGIATLEQSASSMQWTRDEVFATFLDQLCLLRD
jgi:hypothetical protein